MKSQLAKEKETIGGFEFDCKAKIAATLDNSSLVICLRCGWGWPSWGNHLPSRYLTSNKGWIQFQPPPVHLLALQPQFMSNLIHFSFFVPPRLSFILFSTHTCLNIFILQGEKKRKKESEIYVTYCKMLYTHKKNIIKLQEFID